jgi:hypothetical protein
MNEDMFDIIHPTFIIMKDLNDILILTLHFSEIFFDFILIHPQNDLYIFFLGQDVDSCLLFSFF